VRFTSILVTSLALTSLSVVSSYAQSIYAGGNGDGFAVNSFAQPDNILYNIYAGGTDDGFSVSSFAQPDNVLFDIYKGGDEDGFSVSSFAQPDNVLFDIYKGGFEDGFSTSAFAQPDNVLFDIYKGGIADGFAFNSLGSIGSEVPLPVELVSFEGKYQNGAVLLTWTTASELNNERFVLERSPSGLEFEALHSVDGSGTNTAPREYDYTDKRPFQGLNYYRLKQVDFDQTFTFSRIIAVEATEKPGAPIVLFPNPSSKDDLIQIRMVGLVPGTALFVSIKTTSGQNLHSFETTIDDLNQFAIDTKISSQMAPGFYLISVQFNAGSHTAKWIVR